MKNQDINNNFLTYIKKGVNWRLLLILFLFQFIPTIYKLTRIFFLGTLPDNNSFNIASQVLWLNILYEIVVESIVIPVFFIFSKLKNEKDKNQVYTLITIIVFSIYIIFTISIYFNVENILNSLIVNNDELLNQSIKYIKLEVWGTLLYSFLSYLFLTVTLFRFKRYLIISFVVCILYSIISLLLDLFLVTNYDFSLKLSVNGIGINSIITNAICCIVFIVYLSWKNISIWNFNFKSISFKNSYFKQYFVLFAISCLEITVRNLCFYFMVIKPINSLSSSGVYWVSNNYIWTCLLLPITTMSTFIKETFVLEYKNNKFKHQIMFYSIFISIIIFLWLITIPLNPIIIKNLMGENNNYNASSDLVSLLIPFYILFAYSNIIDSIFIKEGKVYLYCIQSLIVNLTLYPVYFILWKLNIWTPSLNSISVMFGLGMTLHFLIDIPLFLIYLRNEKQVVNRLSEKYIIKNGYVSKQNPLENQI